MFEEQELKDQNRLFELEIQAQLDKTPAELQTKEEFVSVRTTKSGK